MILYDLYVPCLSLLTGLVYVDGGLVGEGGGLVGLDVVHVWVAILFPR